MVYFVDFCCLFENCLRTICGKMKVWLYSLRLANTSAILPWLFALTVFSSSPVLLSLWLTTSSSLKCTVYFSSRCTSSTLPPTSTSPPSSRCSRWSMTTRCTMALDIFLVMGLSPARWELCEGVEYNHPCPSAWPDGTLAAGWEGGGCHALSQLSGEGGGTRGMLVITFM